MNTANLLRNDLGGYTYAPQQRVGEKDQRTEILADVRQVAEGLTELCKRVREAWPANVPMPEDLQALLLYQDYALARLRCGTLKRFAEACDK